MFCRITASPDSLRVRRRRRAVAAIALGLACAVLPRSSQSALDRQTLRNAFHALSQLLPVALAPSGWEQAEQSKTVSDALGELASAADQLAQHGKGRDAAFRFLSQSLAHDARTLQDQVARKRYASASYLTERMAETCIACHVRLPADKQPDFAGSLLKGADSVELPPFARAYLQTASRQFDAALQTYETQFGDALLRSDLFDFSDAFTAYLIVALRVRRDAARATRGLDILSRRRDLSAQLEQNLRTWRQALMELEPVLQETPSLERARAVLDEGRARTEFPLDAGDRIHAIVASSLIFRFLDERKPEGLQLAEALYLLARTEAFTARSFEISEGAHYLEEAIRAAPHTPIAERAYARLELESLVDFGGPTGVELPPHFERRLRELRRLSRTKPEPDEPPHTTEAPRRQRSTRP